MALTAAELEIVLKARDDASKALDAVKGKAKELGDAGKAAGDTLGASMKQVGSSLTDVGKGLTMGVTAPLVTLGGTAAKMAGDFEQQMNILTVAARSSGTSLDDLSKAALSVGADTELVGITAAQSADAMTSLYKAGFDTAEIFGGPGGLNSYLNENASLTGALRSAIDLAAASELDLAQATDATIIAMKTFGLDADEASRVANSFVRTADASVASVSDLTAAMANIGPTAATFGMSLETTNTALGILSSRGIAGAEAGTALKSMLTNMMRTTPDVIETWQKLGITMYDASGKMRAIPDIMAELSSALTVGNTLTAERALLTEKESQQLAKLEQKRSDLAAKDLAIRNGTLLGNASLKEREAELKKVDKALELTVFEMESLKQKEGQTVTVTTRVTEEFRNQAVQTLAGTYGMKAMNTLLTEGSAGWKAMETAVASAASVEESAGARTTGFNAAMEQLGGALETIAIKAGGPIITALTNLLQGPVSGLLDKISNLNPAVWDWALKIGLVVAAVGPLLLVLGSLLTTVGSIITIVTTLAPLFATVGAAIGAVAAPVLLVVAAIALLAVAWSRDWGGIATFMTGFWNNTLKPIVDQIVLWFQTNIPVAIAFLSGVWTGTLLPAIQAVGGFITGTLVPILQVIWTWLSTNIPAAISAVSGFWTGTLLPAIQAVAAFFTGTLFPLFAAIANVYLAAMSLALTALAGLWQNVLLPALVAVGLYLAGPIITAFQAVGAFIAETVIPAITTLASSLGETLQPVLQAVGEFIVNTVVPAIQSLVEWFRDKFAPAVQDVSDKINGPFKTAGEWLREKFLGAVTTALGTLGDKLKDVTGFFQGLADKINGLKDKLPSWLTPGSPTPLEIGLLGIGGALEEVVMQFAAFGAKLGGAGLGNLQRFGLAIRDIAKDLKDLASAFHQMNKVEKTEGGIPSLELWANALKESIIRFSRAITEAAKEVKTSTINNARELAKKIEEIFELLRTLGSVLNDLNAIETIPDMRPFGAALKEGIIVTASAILEASATLGDKALKAAAKMANDAKEIISLIGPAVSALASMSDMKEVKDLRGKASGLEEALNVFIYYMNRVATFWKGVALDSAATFAETAQKVIGIIGPAVQALAGFVDFPAVGNLHEKAAFLEETLNLFVYYIRRVAMFWERIALDSAATFSEVAAKVISLVSPAVTALEAMAAYVANANLASAVAAFEPDMIALVGVIERITYHIGAVSENAVKFSAAAAQAVSFIRPGVEALVAVAAYTTGVNLATALDSFETDIKALVRKIEAITYNIGAISENAVKFSAAVVQAISFIKPGIDTLAAVAEYSTGKKLSAAMDAFEADIKALVVKIETITYGIGAISANAVQFSADVASATSYIKGAIETLGTLAGYTAKAGLSKAMSAFEADMRTVLEAVGRIAADLSGDTGIGKANAFAAAATAIRAAIETGLGTLSSLSSGGASSAAAALGEFAKAAKQGMADAVLAIQDGVKKIIEALVPLPKKIADGFASVKWSDIGKGIALGIASGITNHTSNITNAAVRASRAAYEAAKKELGIASPSSVMREKVGAMIGEGMALGITDKIAAIRAAMAEMQAAMSARPQLALAGAGMGGSTAQQNVTRAGDTVNLYYYGQVGQSDARDAAAYLEWRMRTRR